MGRALPDAVTPAGPAPQARRSYRVGVVGCGRKASTIDDEGKCPVNYCRPPCAHAGAYALSTRTRVVAACAPSQASRQAFGARWGVAAESLYADFETMLSREQLDLVSVCTQAPWHAPVTIAAAQAGVSGVLCEKAMATSLAEADAMVAACERHGTKLLVDHPRRFHPTYPLVRQVLHSGEVGRLRAIVATAGGAVVHNGTHLFDLVRYFGGEARDVAAHVTPSPGGDGDGAGQVELAEGVTAYVALHGGLPFSLELLGTEGRITVDASVEGATVWRYGEAAPGRAAPSEPRGPATPWYRGGPCRPRWERHLAPPAGAGSTMLAAVEELIAAVETDREPESSGRDGRAALELALACHASQAQGGARVPLPLADRAFRAASR
jgi:predicted dehydrogenase